MLFSSRKFNIEEKKAGDANENPSLKIDIDFIAVPFVYSKQKWLLTTRDHNRRSVECFLTFLIS